jgi:hypothetical protein
VIARRWLIAVIALSLPALAAAETTRQIRMRVVEAGSGKPVAGAQVRYRAEAREGTSTGHGGRGAMLFDLATVSDASGAIEFPPTQFNPRIFGLFGLNTNYENAEMTITREGYEPLELRNTLRVIPNLDEVIAWQYNGQTVELKPALEKAAKPSVTPPQPMQIRRAPGGLPQHRGAPAPAAR